jgi:TonB family protein
MSGEVMKKILAISVLSVAFFASAVVAQTANSESTPPPISISKKKAEENLEVKTLEPEYPAEARAKGIEGVVRLSVVINTLGNVTEIKVISGNQLFVAPAIALVKRFPYRPFERNGKRVSVITEIDVPFELHPVNRNDIYRSWNEHREAARRLRKDERVEAATQELQSALADAQRLGDLEVADTYGDMAELYAKEGRYSDAEPLLSQRLQFLQRSQIQDELEIANTQGDLAATFALQGELEKAQSMLKLAIPIQEKHLRRATLQGTKDAYAQRLALSLEMQGLIDDKQGRYSTARGFYERAIRLGEKTLPADDEATIMRRYADMLDKTGDHEKAAKVREDAATLQLQLKP